ncbi:kinase/pyrophosphorylase [Nitrosospira sp. Nsp2]|uniref:kinase/pyrophosphorylase n=1 Tax=Nitrosospira sp. Nsp2 TaxID=136548 RepID=UPI000D4BF273|nr:kinase/pyrophosphorylase [Nitrosospira sp. Nsp2]PTR14731.1 kinase/pyrophosphorylase [Nitrosospira sp. Nsp2]
MSIKVAQPPPAGFFLSDPSQIRNNRSKLFGFTVEQLCLHQMRRERKPDSEYASLRNCEHEVRAAEKAERREGIPYLDASSSQIDRRACYGRAASGKLKRQIY